MLHLVSSLCSRLHLHNRLLVILFSVLASIAAAAPLQWVGSNGSNFGFANNWDPSTDLAANPGQDLVLSSSNNATTTILVSNTTTGASELILGSLSIDDTAAIFRNSTTAGLRIASTSSASSSVERTLTFNRSGGNIIALSHGANVSFVSSTVTSTGAPKLTLNLEYSGAGVIDIDGTSKLTASGTNLTITGQGGLTKTGTGNLTLSGNHTYSGGFTLQEGAVTITTSGAVTNNAITNSPFGTGALTIRGGSLIASSNSGRTIYNSINLDGVATITSNVNGTAGNYVVSAIGDGTTTLLSNSTIVVPGPAVDSTNNTSVGGQLTWNQAISGDFGLIKQGAGTLVLNTGSPFTGGFTIADGVVRIDSPANLGKLPAVENADAVIFNGGSLRVTGTSFSSPNRGYRIAAHTTFDIDDATTIRIQGSIRDVTGQAGRLIKAGTGVLGLEPGAGMVYTYSGGTQVDAGVLRLMDATLGDAGSPGASFADNTSLEGNGTIVGNVTVSATTAIIPATYGDINPPNNTIGVTGVGTIVVQGNLDLAPNAASTGLLIFDLEAPGINDQIVVTDGTLSIGSGLLNFASFQFTKSASTASGTYTLLRSDTPIVGTLAATGTIGNLDAFKAQLALSDDAKELDLIVYDVPAIVVQPDTYIGAVVGTPVSLSLTAGGLGLTYQWFKDNTAIPGETNATLSLASAALSDSGTYHIAVSNLAGSIASEDAIVEITAAAIAPSIETAPVAQQAYIGTSASFSVVARGTGPLTYQWSKDSAALVGATEAAFTIPTVAATDDALYTVTITNSAGAITSTAVRLTALTPSLPAVTGQPQSTTTIAHNSLTLAVTYTADPAPTLQWYKNSVAITGATAATLTFSNISSSDAGTYTVRLTNIVGTVTSEAAVVSVAPQNFLSNLSVRASMAAQQNLIVGFVVAGGSKSILVRAAGPALATQGVTGYLADPRLTLFDSHNTSIATNDDWDASLAATFAPLGAFPFVTGSKDAALLQTLASANTAHAPAGTAGGTQLVEVYDAGDNNGVQLANVSARNNCGTGDNILIAGFVIAGSGKKHVLIRAVGPGLTAQGVTGVLADPKLTLYTAKGDAVTSNDNWDATLAATFSTVGAFGLSTGSKDAALLIELDAGVYTVQVAGADGGTGEALVEVYDADL